MALDGRGNSSIRRAPPDYYATLGVAGDATLAEIEGAYWAKAKERKDDLRLLNAAYEVLGHADRRAAYDAERRALPAQPPLPTGPAALSEDAPRIQGKLRGFLH